MSNIPEHDSEEEGECDTGEHSRVHLLVIWHAIGVNDQLEGPSELVIVEGGRHDELIIDDSLADNEVGAHLIVHTILLHDELFTVFSGDPDEATH